MRLSPAYGATAGISFDGPRDDQAEPVARQRRRLAELLESLDEEQWRAPTRCAGWSVQDVVAHLVTVNAFWEASVRAGLSGAPTQVLANFDPVAHPALLVEPLRELPPAEVFDRFARSDEGLLDALDSVHDEQWDLPGESPAGHVPMRLLAQHALWDSWVHERDVALPLGLVPAVEGDEVISCLRYAAAIGPYLASSWPESDRIAGTFAVEATAPDCTVCVIVDSAVTVTAAPPPPDAARLRGDATTLVDALSVRRPLPDDAPPEWHALARTLATVFDQ